MEFNCGDLFVTKDGFVIRELGSTDFDVITKGINTVHVKVEEPSINYYKNVFIEETYFNEHIKENEQAFIQSHISGYIQSRHDIIVDMYNRGYSINKISLILSWDTDYVESILIASKLYNP